MQAALFIVSWATLALVVLLVLRLAAAGLRERSKPELLIAGFFGCGAVGYGAILLLRTPVGGSEAANAVLTSTTYTAFGLTVVWLVLFTRQVFRREARWGSVLAGTIVTVAVGLLLVAQVGVPLLSFPRAWIDPGGPVYWMTAGTKAVGFFWGALEALLYWRMARRRVALGLSTPMLANRFLLWGIWSGAAASILVVRVLSQLAVARAVLLTNPPIAVVLLQLVAGVVCAGAVWLTFSPPASYQRWIERTAQAA